MSNLKELVICIASPSSLGEKFFRSLVVQPVHARLGALLCPSLRRFGLKYDRWFRSSERLDLVQIFGEIIRARKHSNCPLESFSLWKRSSQKNPLELIERLEMSLEAFTYLASESGIEGESTAMEFMQPNSSGESPLPPQSDQLIVPWRERGNSEQQE
jgi:hypothetical protein